MKLLRRFVIPVLGGVGGWAYGMYLLPLSPLFGLLGVVVVSVALGWVVHERVISKRQLLWLDHVALSLRAYRDKSVDELVRMPDPLTMVMDSNHYFMLKLPLRVVLKAKLVGPAGWEAPDV